MYHYSYVFPDQVYKKVNYYKDSVSRNNCIDNYFNDVYLPWVTGDIDKKNYIEEMWNGVHEFKPHVRGECKTSEFIGEHPESIKNNMDNLLIKFKNQIKKYGIN